MSFEAPSALWLLLLLMPAAAICFARLTPDGIVPSKLLYNGRRRRLNRRLMARLCILLAMGLVIVELARPRLQRSGEDGRGSASVALLLDLSGSMEARGLKSGAEVPDEENLTGTRLELAKKVTLDLLEKLHGRNIALIAFARRAYMVSPLTKSTPSLKERLSELEILEYEDGTAISDALICACRTMEQSHIWGAKRIYLISDGADHSEAESRKKAVKMLQKAEIAVYPIIVGADYLYHPMRDSRGKLSWQANGEKADGTMIETLATETGGRIVTSDELTDTGQRQGKTFDLNGICLLVAILFLTLAGLLNFL
ncbi:MAG: VWA domain-containing protein [Victivallales bacterium]|nr:VWA domain-containing protein [Victivallales bacterium]